MDDNCQAFLKGQFIMAMPGLADPNFSQTVTCISELTAQGGMGIIVNRVHPFLSGKDLFDELKIECIPDIKSIPVHIGGPVHVNEIFILHGPPFEWEGCFIITASLAMSNTGDILEAIAKGRGPKSFIITLGCAGWGPGQLESEIKKNAWLTCPVAEEIVFDVPVEARWEAAVKTLGINPSQLLDKGGHA